MGRGQPEELLVTATLLTKPIPSEKALWSSQLTDDVARRGEIQKQPIGRTNATTPTFEATKFYIALYYLGRKYSAENSNGLAKYSIVRQ